MQLQVESVTDLANDPALVVHVNSIQAELENGSKAVGEANDKQAAMSSELRTMTDAIEAQFPSLRAAVSIR